MLPAPLVTRWSAPSASSSSSDSVSYDYSGFDDLVKRQDALGALRDNKFASMYSGDVPSAVTAGNKIRDLLVAIRHHAPGATERQPVQLVTPLVRTASRSSSTNNSMSGGDMHFGNRPDVNVPPANNPPPDARPGGRPLAAAKPKPVQRAGGPALDARGADWEQRAIQRRLDEYNAGIDMDGPFDVSDAPLAPDVRQRWMRNPLV